MIEIELDLHIVPGDLVGDLVAHGLPDQEIARIVGVVEGFKMQGDAAFGGPA